MNLDKYKNDVIETIVIFIVVFIIVGLGPFLVSGVWPPFTSVLSDSMEPNINTGDIVFIVDNERYVSDNNSFAGVSPMENGAVNSFNEYGNIIVFYPDGDKTNIPVIHRAAFYVEEDENWVQKVNKNSLISNSCSEISNCPAPHNGLITIGDNNSNYDQITGLSEPVKEEWIIGKAKYRIPYIGTIRNAMEHISPSITVPQYSPTVLHN